MHMNKHLQTVGALFALTAVVACGEPDATGNATGSAAALPATVAPEAPDRSHSQQADVAAPTAAPSAGGEGTGDAQASGNAAFDPGNSRFLIDGRQVVLSDGTSQVAAAPGSASMVTTRYLGKHARGDLTNDGRDDLAYLVTRDGGGSGRFTYVVVARNGPTGYRTTNAFPVGDRVEPQSLRIVSQRLEVNFLGRDRAEPMTAPPSRPSVLLLKVTPDGVLEGLMK
jgi:hypothetical protein